MADSKKAAKSGGKQNSVNAAVPMSTPPPIKERVIEPEEYLPGVPEGPVNDPRVLEWIREMLTSYIEAPDSTGTTSTKWQLHGLSNVHWQSLNLTFQVVWRERRSGRTIVQGYRIQMPGKVVQVITLPGPDAGKSA